MRDVTVYLGQEWVVNHKLDEIMWPPEIVEQMCKEPDITPIPAQEIISEWSWT